jgi:nitrogenase molybdenum-iron protein alpha chain
MVNFARDIYQGIYAPVWRFQGGLPEAEKEVEAE